MTFDHEEELHKISNDYKDARYDKCYIFRGSLL